MSDVIIEGETWRYSLSAAEYAAWDIYANTHPWLFHGQGSYEGILRMFLSHYRLGYDLNAMFAKRSEDTYLPVGNLTL